MSTLRERLEKKIEGEAVQCFVDHCTGFCDPDPQDFKCAYKAGANLMLDLVCDLAEALEKISPTEKRLDSGYGSINRPMTEREGIAMQALAKIRKLTGGEG